MKLRGAPYPHPRKKQEGAKREACREMWPQRTQPHRPGRAQLIPKTGVSLKMANKSPALSSAHHSPWSNASSSAVQQVYCEFSVSRRESQRGLGTYPRSHSKSTADSIPAWRPA